MKVRELVRAFLAKVLQPTSVTIIGMGSDKPRLQIEWPWFTAECELIDPPEQPSSMGN